MARGSTFATLDFYETGNAIWALDREIARMRLVMRNMDAETIAQVEPLAASLQDLHDRLNVRYAPVLARALGRDTDTKSAQ